MESQWASFSLGEKVVRRCGAPLRGDGPDEGLKLAEKSRQVQAPHLPFGHPLPRGEEGPEADAECSESVLIQVPNDCPASNDEWTFAHGKWHSIEQCRVINIRVIIQSSNNAYGQCCGVVIGPINKGDAQIAIKTDSRGRAMPARLAGWMAFIWIPCNKMRAINTSLKIYRALAAPFYRREKCNVACNMRSVCILPNCCHLSAEAKEPNSLFCASVSVSNRPPASMK